MFKIDWAKAWNEMEIASLADRRSGLDGRSVYDSCVYVVATRRGARLPMEFVGATLGM